MRQADLSSARSHPTRCRSCCPTANADMMARWRALHGDHTSLAAVARAVGHLQRLDALAGAYAVVSADDERAVIAVGHRLS